MTNDAGRNFNLDGRASSFCACSSPAVNTTSSNISERHRGFHEEETSWTAGLMFGEEIGVRINIQVERIWPEESLITRWQENATATNQH